MVAKPKTTVYFNFGSMNSGKSLELIKVAYNYKENEIDCLILKPNIDTRKKNKVYSRTGLEIDAIDIETEQSNFLKKVLSDNKSKVILVEESQFFSKEVIDILIDYAYENNMYSLMFFGLKVDFRGELFEGSKRIIERADKLQESTSICWCGKKARQNARVVNGKVIKDGPTILVEDETTVVNYVTLCNYHYDTGEISDT